MLRIWARKSRLRYRFVTLSKTWHDRTEEGINLRDCLQIKSVEVIDFRCQLDVAMGRPSGKCTGGDRSSMDQSNVPMVSSW